MNGLRIAVFLGLAASLLPAQELRDYERKVTEFTLANGLHFILLERHQVPVVSFHTYLNAGSAEDPAGQSGLSNLLARVAFDGTETVGSRDWPAEKKALDDLELAIDRMDEERNQGAKSSPGSMAAVQVTVNSALRAAQVLENPNEFMRAFQENGAVHMGSLAKPDSIETTYSLPSNRIELWFLLESQRLAHPVFRGFYRERQAMLTEASALAGGRSAAHLRQALLGCAFESLPYRNPILGRPEDIVSLRVADARNFLNTYGGPGNIVISIVGDVDPGNARLLAEKYFAPIPPKPRPPAPHMQEVMQLGPKTVSLWGEGQPLLMIGYKRPPETHLDDVVLDFIQMILGDKQTGWMYKELVEGKRIAQDADAAAALPGGVYNNLFVLTVVPARDHTVEENRKAVDELVSRLQSRPVDPETLTRVRNVLKLRAATILGSNQALASLLPRFVVQFGDWRKLFAIAPQYEQVTAEDLQRVATLYLTPAGRTTATITAGPEAAASVSGGQQ